MTIIYHLLYTEFLDTGSEYCRAGAVTMHYTPKDIAQVTYVHYLLPAHLEHVQPIHHKCLSKRPLMT